MPKQYREKMTVTKDGQVIKESIPLSPEVPPPGEDEEQEQEEMDDELSPEEEAYYEVTQSLVRQDLKLRVSRILDDGRERGCGSIAPEEVKTRGIQAALQSRFGGGTFKVDFTDMSSGRPVSTIVEVEGEPKLTGTETTPGSGITLNMPKGGGDSSVIPIINMLSTQLNKSQELTNALIIQLASNKQQAQPATVAGMTLDQLAVMKEIFASRKEDSGEKLREWMGLFKSLVENIAPIIAPQSDNPWVAFAQQILPSVKETLGSFIARAPAGTPTRTALPAGTPTGAVGASVQPQKPISQEDIQLIRNLFETMYLRPLIDAAKQDLDPYTMTFNFRAQLGGDTTKFLPSLGLDTIASFYSTYPETQALQEWFNEFFWFMANPTLTPPPDEDEDQEAAPVPNNGSGGAAAVVEEQKRGPGRPKKPVQSPEVITGDVKVDK